MKRIVITGGRGHIAQKIASVFSDAGWHVSAPGRDALDVSDPVAITRYFQSQQPDLLVCCAGIVSDGPLLRLSEEVWDQTVRVNFDGAARAALAALPAMVSRKEGHIVFLSSNSALKPPKGQAAYATAKAGLLGLTSSLAKEYGCFNIRVNAILPGFIETALTSEVTLQRKGALLAEHALNRFNTPEAVAAFIYFLHEHLPHTSGQVFRLDSRPD